MRKDYQTVPVEKFKYSVLVRPADKIDRLYLDEFKLLAKIKLLPIQMQLAVFSLFS